MDLPFVKVDVTTMGAWSSTAIRRCVPRVSIILGKPGDSSSA